MKVAGLQLDIAWEDPDRNFAKIDPWAATAAQAGARLLVLPEMYACGFSMNIKSIAEPPDGASTKFLQACARRHGLWVCGSLPLREGNDPRPYNALILSDPGGSLTTYRKIHPFTFAKEHEHYAAGSKHITVDIEGLRTTLFVCYDLRFANEFWDAAMATDCYVVVANWPARRREHWQTLLRARAIENQAFVVGVNRTGTGNEIEYVGDSCIIDPWGAVLVSSSQDETLILADVDPRRVRDARARFPVLSDRRTPDDATPTGAGETNKKQ